MKTVAILCILFATSPAFAKTPKTHIFHQQELLVPVGNQKPNVTQMDMCFSPNIPGQDPSPHCGTAGQRHAQDTFCHAKGYKKSTGQLLTMPIDGGTRTIGTGSKCEGGCKTFQQIECTM